MSKRRLSTVLSSRNWLGGGFVSVVLILLVAVPVVINIQGRAMHQGIKDFGAPATTAASDIQKSLSHEVSGVIGLQESGEPRYAELYKQQRTLVPHPHHHFRQIARAIIEETLFAQAVGLHIAVPVEDSEHRPVFQYPGTVVRRRRFCGYVVLLGDVNFIQLRTPLEAASGAFFRFTSRS